MNDWTYKRKLAIVEADDFMDRADRNGLNYLFSWKARYPNFKISLFTVPEKTSPGMLNLIGRNYDWIQLLPHGFNHEGNFECYGWSYEKTRSILERIEREEWNVGKDGECACPEPAYKKIFKAPGWCITPGYNGYPAADKDPLKEDPQAVYKALKDKDYVIFDRHYNKSVRPIGSKIVCVDCQTNLVHFHTWNVPSGDINGRNGFQDIEENFGVPWTTETTFKFVSEAWEEGLFLPCKD